MPVIASRISPQSETFKSNAAHLLAQIEKFRGLERAVIAHSSQQAERFAKRGQILPRERVARLLDHGTPFLELSTLAGLGMHDDDGGARVMGGGSVVGIGIVSGKRALILASDSAIKGGTISPMGLKKSLRAQEIAKENKLPLIYLVESGGANLLYQSEMFVEGGRSFANQARLSAAGIPQIAVVHGSSTAGGAYLPGLSDYVILVKEKTKIFLAGPPLVKAAIGEEASDEELGGADLHASTTGLGEYLARDDAHALAIARDLVAKLKWDRVSRQEKGAPPKYDAEELLGIVPVSEREPYDVREIIARLVDGSDFLDFKRDYGAETVCGYAAVDGFEVGILGNNGAIQPDGSTKAAQFIQLCDQAGMPLIFLQNTTGYMVGREAERTGAVKHGSKMIQAVANARVPKLTVIVGGSYGAGNYGMCGRGFRSALHLFLAECARGRDGRAAGREGDGGDHAGEVREIRPGRERAGAEADVGSDRAAARPGVDRALRNRAALGRRHYRPARHPQNSVALSFYCCGGRCPRVASQRIWGGETVSERLPSRGSEMTEKRAAQDQSLKVEKPGADKKKRLAAALRRNLAKRKDTKEAKSVDNP